MRLRKNRRFILILFSYLALTTLGAQTLYWVGGSGNFNDPAHWSLTRDGSPSNLLPNANTTIVFGESPQHSVQNIYFTTEFSVKKLVVRTYDPVNFLKSGTAQKLNIREGFNLEAAKFNSEIDFEVNNPTPGTQAELISTGSSVLGNNITLISGHWLVNNIKLSTSGQLTIRNAAIEFNNSVVEAGDLVIQNSSSLGFKKSYLKIYNKVTFRNNNNLVLEGAYLNKKLLETGDFELAANPVSGKIIGSGNQTNAVCISTPIIVRPSCSPGCDGKIIFTLPNYSCYLPTYTVTSYNIDILSTASCVAIAGLTNVGPGTYTISNVCNCGTAYNIAVKDQNGTFMESESASVIQPQISALAFSTSTLNCYGACTGSVNLAFIGGSAPYSYTVIPPTGASYTTTSGGGLTVTNLCAGTLSIIPKDQNLCVGSYTFDVASPPVILSNSVVTNVRCKSACNGSLSISPTGGQPNYTVSFSSGFSVTTTPSAAVNSGALCPGAISATITDSKGCSVVTSTTITEPTEILITPSQTNIICNGINTGVASVLVSGGTPSYNFSWVPAIGTTSIITNLGVGMQTVTITDQNSCAKTSTFNITQPPAITLTPTFTNVVCSGSCTGGASVAASGGTGAFTYTWVGPGNATLSTGSQNSLDNLCAGAYTVFVKDTPNGCAGSVVISITQPPTLTLSIVTRSVSCYGLSDGGATVTASAGNSASYTYNWLPGPLTTSAVTGIPAGNYTLTVTDALSCPIQTIFPITQPALVVTSAVTQTNLICNSLNNSCNGIINASPSGGTPPYNYTLTSPAVTVTSLPPYNSLCAGNYTLIIKDQSGCPLQSLVTLTQPNAVVSTITSTNLNCFGIPTGVLSTSVSGGSSTYTLTWATPTGPASGGTLTNQPAGNYTLYAIDSNSCTAQATATLIQPTALNISVGTSTITCFSLCNGVLTSTVTGGTAPYSYTWKNALNVTVGTSSTATSLCPGLYTLTIIDNKLCVKTATAEVISPGPIVLTSTTTPVSCFGSANGSASVTASGGTPSFTFQFNSTPTVSNTTGILTGQPAGNYVATITDFAGCVQTHPFTIASPASLAAVLSGTGSCNLCTGSATVTPSAGTAPYTYTWVSSLGGSFPATPTLSNLCPGTYTVNIRDFNGCVTSGSISLQQVITVTINLGGTSILCNGASTGSATALGSGGTGPNYTYLWTPSNQTGSVITGVPAGSYTVRVTDSSIPASCSSTAAITLTEPPSLTVTSTQTNVTCYGYSDGAASATISGGTPGTPIPYTYTWTPGNMQGTTGIAPASSLTAGVYTLNIRDGNLCPSARTITITQSPAIAIPLTTSPPAGCIASLANGSICTTPSGGSGSGYTYTLMPLGTTSTTGCFTGLGGGAYSIIVMDNQGCTNSSVTTLSNPSGPTITVSSTSVACNGFSTAVASATATGITPFYSFNWTPATTSVITANTTTATGLHAGTYFVSATDGNNCVATRSILIVEAPAYTINPVIANLRCNNAPTGSITIAPVGGTPNTPVSYTFAWQPAAAVTGQGTRTITNLAAGVYTLTINDKNNCLVPYTYTVTQPAPIGITAVTTSLQCFNVCTGSIVATGTGGTGALNYSWTPVGGTSSVAVNLCASSGGIPIIYTLTATDANTCVSSQTYSLSQPSQLTSTVSLINATCSNSCNAVATLTANGGTPGYTYSWSSSTLTTVSLGSLCGGSYTAYVTDAKGCVNVNSFTVTPPAPLSVTLTPRNPLCNAACNGSIATVLSGAQGTVSYSWLPAGSGQSPTGLCATPNPVYTLVATDQNSCRVTAVATLTNPPALTTTVSSINPLCHNDSNGQASISVGNANGALTYTWLPTGPPTKTTQAVSGLSAGIFTVQVRDANNCQASQTFTLINPPTLTVTTSVNPASCGQSNGSITANPSGGTPGSPTPYTYVWAGVVSSASFVTGIPAGSYTVNVSDAAGCTVSANVLLNNSSGPNVIPVITSSIVCHAQCTGAASVNAAGIVGGIAPYTVSWVVPASPLVALTSLCTGSYTAKVVDAVGCLAYTTVTIAEPPSLTVTPTISLPLCPGVCSGSIALTTSGGLAPYSYSWTSASSTSSVITGLCADDYTVQITYNNVCSTTSVINLPDQSSITVVPTVTNNICFGTCNGVAHVSISGGTAPYTAGWNNGLTGNTLNNLCNGSYSVIVTDNNGCTNTTTAAITSGAQITSSTSIVSPSCGVCNGTASVSASGGQLPFTFNWSNSATTPTIANLCAGIYQVVISDAASCSQTHTVVVNNSNGITSENFNVKAIPCSGSCVGEATVSAVGGTAPFTYNWINPAVTNSVITNLCPGTYFVQMSDAAGCLRTASVTINPLVTLTVSPFVFPPSCGASNGSINIVIAGGTPSYAVVWNPPAGQTTSLTNLSTGLYSYTVTESGTNSCSISNAINISNTSGPVIAANQNNVNCFGNCTGSITTVITSTSIPFTYAWSNNATTSSVTSLCKGIITLTVTDGNLCKTLESYTITDNPLLQLGQSTVHNPQCFGACNGSIQLVPTGGTLPYTYSWTIPNGNMNPMVSLCDGVYSATVTDTKGCIVSSPSYTIKSASAISLAITTQSSSCSSAADGGINLAATGGIPDYVFTWQGPAFTATTQNISNLFSGTYSLNVTDDLGCKKDTVLNIIPSLTVTANAGKDAMICPETGTVTLTANASNTNYKWFSVLDKNRSNVLSEGPALFVEKLSEAASYVLVATSTVPVCYAEDTVKVNLYDLPAVDAGRDFTIPVYSTVTIGGHPTYWGTATLTWSPAEYLNDAFVSNPIASNTVNTTYTLTITDQNGCISSDTIHVFLYPELNITSGFTPNGDGKNDLWIIDYIDQFPATTVDIFNRWGDSVFSSQGYQTPFDGRYKGTDLPVGTYYYIIKLNHPGYPKPITGPLTIFR